MQALYLRMHSHHCTLLPAVSAINVFPAPRVCVCVLCLCHLAAFDRPATVGIEVHEDGHSLGVLLESELRVRSLGRLRQDWNRLRRAPIG